MARSVFHVAVFLGAVSGLGCVPHIATGADGEAASLEGMGTAAAVREGVSHRVFVAGAEGEAKAPETGSIALDSREYRPRTFEFWKLLRSARAVESRDSLVLRDAGSEDLNGETLKPAEGAFEASRSVPGMWELFAASEVAGLEFFSTWERVLAESPELSNFRPVAEQEGLFALRRWVPPGTRVTIYDSHCRPLNVERTPGGGLRGEMILRMDDAEVSVEHHRFFEIDLSLRCRMDLGVTYEFLPALSGHRLTAVSNWDEQHREWSHVHDFGESEDDHARFPIAELRIAQVTGDIAWLERTQNLELLPAIVPYDSAPIGCASEERRWCDGNGECFFGVSLSAANGSVSEELREADGRFVRQQCDVNDDAGEEDGVKAESDWGHWCHAEHVVAVEDAEARRDIVGVQFVRRNAQASRRLDAYLFRTQAACKTYRKEHPDAAYVEWNVPW